MGSKTTPEVPRKKRGGGLRWGFIRRQKNGPAGLRFWASESCPGA